MDPAQPTDDNGTPKGARVNGGSVSVYLGYAELDGDPTPEGPTTTIETYRVIARPGYPPSRSPPNEPSIVLATVSLPQKCGSISIDDRACRVEIMSNRVLFELITDLEQRVRTLSGDTTEPHASGVSGTYELIR